MNKLSRNLIFFNMGFFDELENLFVTESLDKSFTVQCVGGGAVVISGYKKIESLETSKIIILTKNGTRVIVTGAKLYIKKLEENEVVLAGRILDINFEYLGGSL